MRAEAVRSATIQAIPIGCRKLEEVLLSRWVASEAKFVVAEFDWADPLDAALGVQIVRFRPGVDPYDA
jgi:hypothetical protein